MELFRHTKIAKILSKMAILRKSGFSYLIFFENSWSLNMKCGYLRIVIRIFATYCIHVSNRCKQIASFFRHHSDTEAEVKTLKNATLRRHFLVTLFCHDLAQWVILQRMVLKWPKIAQKKPKKLSKKV